MLMEAIHAATVFANDVRYEHFSGTSLVGDLIEALHNLLSQSSGLLRSTSPVAQSGEKDKSTIIAVTQMELYLYPPLQHV